MLEMLKFRHFDSLSYFLTGTYSEGAVHVEKHNSAKRIVQRRKVQSAAKCGRVRSELKEKESQITKRQSLDQGLPFFLFALFSSKSAAHFSEDL